MRRVERVFCSLHERTIKTASLLLDEVEISGRSRVISGTLAQAWLLLDEMEMQWVPLSYTWRLNERHYGVSPTAAAAETGS